MAVIQAQVLRCESLGVSVLCCPEAFLGGLADHGRDPLNSALQVSRGDLDPIAVAVGVEGLTTILGFSELDDGRLFNSAAVCRQGRVVGTYRKRHPALRRSVYQPGRDSPVFRVGQLTFGVVICLDSTFPEPARTLAGNGASVLFIPTNNALPVHRADPGLVEEARACDLALAQEYGVWVVRADVAGDTSDLRSWGASRITDPSGLTIAAARPLVQELLIAEITADPTTP